MTKISMDFEGEQNRKRCDDATRHFEDNGAVLSQVRWRGRLDNTTGEYRRVASGFTTLIPDAGPDVICNMPR